MRWRSARSGRERPAPGRTRGGGEPAAVGAPGLDGGVVTSAAILASLGVVMVYSATAPLAMGSAVPPLFLKHLAAMGVAIACAVGALWIPLDRWQRLALPAWGASCALLAATLAVGPEINGAQRWLRIPGLGLTFQPAEIAKWATVMAVASVLARAGGRGVARFTALRSVALLAAPPVALMLSQPDFGNAAVLLALVALLLFVAGMPLRLLAGPAALAGFGAGLYVALRPYALARWRGFLDPWERAHHEGFQLVQSFVAFGRGGAAGVGLGDGRQKLSYLPEAHTDFILAVVAEELGLVGVLVVLGAFAALVVAGTRIAGRARDRFAVLVGFGMTAAIAVPAAVNAAVVMGLLPTTGFTLPFLSFGGNSLVVCGLALGILLRIASHEAAPPEGRIARWWRRRRA